MVIFTSPELAFKVKFLPGVVLNVFSLIVFNVLPPNSLYVPHAAIFRENKVKIIKNFARGSGIILDPAYTAKAFVAYYEEFLKKRKGKKWILSRERELLLLSF